MDAARLTGGPFSSRHGLILDWDQAPNESAVLAIIRAQAIPSGTFSLLDLPAEILLQIIDCLDPVSLAKIRLTCRTIYQSAPLRIERVFISPHSINIKTFLAIAGHDYYRTKVKEIIYDDAIYNYEAVDRIYRVGEIINRDFQLSRSENLYRLYERAMKNGMRENNYTIFQLLSARTQMSFEETTKHYAQMIADQEVCRQGDHDFDALVWGFKQFVNLERITLTPAAHGFIFRPLYRTPMIRSFPFGFNYPIPVGWKPAQQFHRLPGMATAWNRDNRTYRQNLEMYRGFSITLAALRTYLESPFRRNHPIEFCADGLLLNLGLSPRVFDSPCTEADNFRFMLSQPGFRRLELTFTADLMDFDNFHCFRSGLFREALGHCRDLQYFSFTTTGFRDSSTMRHWGALTLQDTVPLDVLFPISSWPQLKHFGLSGWRVYGPHLVDFLRELPETVESIELSRLIFVEFSGTHSALLEAIRDRLDWKQRHPAKRPHLKMIFQQSPGIGIFVDKELDAFIYSDGPNPLGEVCPSQPYTDTIRRGFGIIKDLLDPLYERPYQ
ncbi:F-box domain, cyclin-like protein [Ascosphaera apis ARSEF 7405]|uniref:F-box domain, cyclin-like protein n=1 Tax=Ascosphaera apis ARSEF 7405 TaxID=392613 RepID=A0A168AWH2_9EURO|nr:F-box domain, cyclin-like protein [Ascosphaera apis ARSEF 7405]